MALQTSPAFASVLEIMKWSMKPLQYAVCRVNTLRITPKEALEKLRVELVREAARTGRATPTAELHPLLRDTIVISTWPGRKPLLEPQPDRPKYPLVVVDAPCAYGISRGSHIYNNGVLAISENASIGDTVSVEVFWEGTRRWIAYGKLCSLPLTPEECAAKNERDNKCVVEVTEGVSVLPPISRELIKQGILTVQNLPSILASHILNPQPGERVLCSGCTVMTLHLATLSDNKADVVATHQSGRRVRELTERSKLFGANVTAVCAKIEEYVENETGKFDCVLIKPCASTYGSRPCIDENIFMDGCVNGQSRFILEAAVKAVKPGGRIVLYTGSAAPVESDGALRWLIDHHNVKLVATQPRLTPVGGQGPVPMSSWMRLSVEEERLIHRFGPHIQGLDSDPVNLDAPVALIACLTKTH